MKKLFIILITVCLLLVGSTIGAEDKKAEVKYEVKITVTYNALSIKDADRVTGNALRNHQDACDVKVVTKKVSSNDGYIMFTTSSDLDIASE